VNRKEAIRSHVRQGEKKRKRGKKFRVTNLRKRHEKESVRSSKKTQKERRGGKRTQRVRGGGREGVDVTESKKENGVWVPLDKIGAVPVSQAPAAGPSKEEET